MCQPEWTGGRIISGSPEWVDRAKKVPSPSPTWVAPQNVSLCSEDGLRRIPFKKQKTQGVFLCFSFNCGRAGGQRAGRGRELLPVSGKRRNLGEQLSRTSLFTFLSVPLLRRQGPRPDICSSASLWIAFFPLTFQRPGPFSLARSGIWASTPHCLRASYS